MPRFDGTGPMGQGPKTGRGQGPCGTGAMRGILGRGGRRRIISTKDQLATLENEEKNLEEELKLVRDEKIALEQDQKK